MTLLGRDLEIAALGRILDDVSSGAGTVVMLTGDAGIGKTVMAEELTSLAEHSGFIVRWGRSHEEQGAPPFWPWIQAFREQLGKHDVRDLPTLMGLGTASRSNDDPESARFRLFDAASTHIRNAARKTPIALVLDDLHWADQPSLLLLAFLARELYRSPVLLVGTYRDVEVDVRHPLAQTVGELARFRLQTLALRGLRANAVARLLKDALGETPPPELVRSVHAQTEGNPFFVIEIAHWLARERAAGVGDEVAAIRVPESVKAVLARRFHRLGELSHDVLVTAAVIGREFDFELLRELREDVDESRLLSVIAEARDHHVIVETSPSAERYQFRHALIRDVLYREPSPSHRARLHARIATALEERTQDVPVSQLAYHFTAAESLLGAEKRVAYSKMAGLEALATHAYDDARRHFESAWDILKSAPLDGESAEVLFGLGTSEAATSVRWNRQQAWEHLRCAVDYYLDIGETDRAVSAVTHPALTPEGTLGVAPVIEVVLGRVSRDSLEEGWLVARLAAASYFETGDYDEARLRFQRALAVARRHRDETLELRALALKTSVDHFDLRWADVLAGSQRVIALARKHDDPHAECYARYRAAYALMCTGRSTEAKIEAAANLTRAERLQDRGLLEDALYVNATLAQLEGSWTKARELSDRGLEISASGLPLAHNRVLLEYELGETERGTRYLEQLIESTARAGPYPLRDIFVPLATAQTTPIAEPKTDSKDVITTPGSATVPVARVALEMARALGSMDARDMEAIEDHLHRLRPFGGLIVAPCLVTDRLLGRLALTLGRARDAIQHFERAESFYRSASYWPELAWTCYELVGALLDRDAKGDRARAGALIVEAQDLATKLGMRPLGRRLSEFRARHRTKLVRKPGGLTGRELEVLALVASGLTNKEIADRLCISANTVAVHVARILEKTGSGNRTEAAHYAVQHDLV